MSTVNCICAPEMLPYTMVVCGAEHAIGCVRVLQALYKKDKGEEYEEEDSAYKNFGLYGNYYACCDGNYRFCKLLDELLQYHAGS